MNMLLLSIATTSFLISTIVYFDKIRPDYSFIKQTISELGESGATNAKTVSWLVFFPVGLSCAVIGLVQYQSNNGTIALLAGSLAVGYLAAAIFPCDRGSPIVGTWKQTLHNIGGAFQYFGGFVALTQLGGDQTFYNYLSYAVAIALAGLSITLITPVRGLLQRLGEVALFGGLIFSLWSEL